MTDETDFSPGDVVLDRDDDNPDPALVVNCIPGATADEWDVSDDQTVAETNPDYPEDASVVIVVFEHNFDDDILEWNREEPIALTDFADTPMKYYAFPVPRLVRDERSAESSDESDSPTLTDIQYVADERAEDLRAMGYESVEDVADADQSALAEVEGVGNTRAAQITASAGDLPGELPVDSAADAPDETESDPDEDRETTEADGDNLSAAVVALSRFLDSDGMDATIADDGQSVRVANADHSYRVSLDSGVEGDGPHRSQLAETVEKVRAATQQTDS